MGLHGVAELLPAGGRGAAPRRHRGRGRADAPLVVPERARAARAGVDCARRARVQGVPRGVGPVRARRQVRFGAAASHLRRRDRRLVESAHAASRPVFVTRRWTPASPRASTASPTGSCSGSGPTPRTCRWRCRRIASGRGGGAWTRTSSPSTASTRSRSRAGWRTRSTTATATLPAAFGAYALSFDPHLDPEHPPAARAGWCADLSRGRAVLRRTPTIRRRPHGPLAPGR